MHPLYMRWTKRLAFILAFFLLLRAIGIFNYFYLTSFSRFQWPHLTAAELKRQVHLQLQGLPSEIAPIYNLSQFWPTISPKCHPNKNAKNSKITAILLAVRSAPDRIERRQAIRSTWGLNSLKFGVLFRTIFVMGNRLGNMDFHTDLLEENGQHGDLLVGHFMDHYRNSTLKTQHVLNYAVVGMPFDECGTKIGTGKATEEFLFLLDDDELLLPWNLAMALATRNEGEGQHLYTGDAMHGARPSRTVFRKWKISIDEYPYDLYPPYIQGNAVLLSGHTVRAFRLAMEYMKPFIWDDVYLGIIAHALEIEASHEPKMPRSWSWRQLPELIAAHGFTPEQIRAIYADLMKNAQ